MLGLCQGSHLWGATDSPWLTSSQSPHSNSETQSTTTGGDTLPRSSSPSRPVPYSQPVPPVAGRTVRSDRSSVPRWPGTPVNLIYERRLCEWHWEGTSTTKRLVPFSKWFPPQRGSLWTKQKGFSNNLREWLYLQYWDNRVQRKSFFVCVSL